MPILLLLLFILGFPAHAQFQNQSVLSSGNWYKIAVSSGGVYSLSYSDLSDFGINPAALDPKSLALYGNGGRMLPQKNSAPRIDDLAENAIMVTGAGDGTFDPGDFILFYADGPKYWYYDSTNSRFTHELNLYSDTAYYFLRTDNPIPGKRISVDSTVLQGKKISSYIGRYFHEKDSFNFLFSGRQWFGEKFDSVFTFNQTFNVPVGDYSGDSVSFKVSLAGKSYVQTSFNILVSDSLIDSIAFLNFGKEDWEAITDIETRYYTLPASLIHNGIISLTLKYDNSGMYSPQPSKFFFGGLLDYFEVFVEKPIIPDSIQNHFQFLSTLDPGNYTFEVINPGSARIWDISDPLNPIEKKLISDSTGTSFCASGGSPLEFISWKGLSQKSPLSVKFIDNQNLHGIMTAPDLLIVTYPAFQSAAEQLAAFHRKWDNMNVEIVKTDQIYNEFSSGKMDICAIRDFSRMLFQRSSSSDSLKYLLLMGACSYDYKDRIPNNTNFVPIYESRNSIDKLKSYGSDDFFGFMEPQEGEWEETASGNETMDIAVGRLPARTLAEAETVVNKIITYASSEMGDWRAKITLFAEDGNYNLHLDNSEQHSTYLNQNDPDVLQNKIYIDHYDQVTINGADRCPEAIVAIDSVINNGIGVFNFIGHGGWNGLTTENVINFTSINAWKNPTKLPLFITATCGVGVFDNPARYSLGETFVMRGNSGGIGIISGTRSAYSTANLLMNTAILDYLYIPGIKFGEIMRLSKNNSFSSVYNRHFGFLGDPALNFIFPDNNVVLTAVNNASIPAADTLKALSKVVLEGQVTDPKGYLLSNFNGTVEVIIFDKQGVEYTKGAALAWEQPGPAVSYPVLKDHLCKGDAAVTNGNFSITFILPKQAADTLGASRIFMYAASDDGRTDAVGASTNFVTGGIDSTALFADTIAPVIHVYLDSTNFQSGEQVSSHPILLATLFDSSGINLSTRDSANVLLTVINSDSTIILSKDYTSDSLDFMKGKVTYPFSGLSNGDYTLSLSASDPYNNRSTASITFIVFDSVLTLTPKVLTETGTFSAFPNPFPTSARFKVPASAEIFDLYIYSVNGMLVKQFLNQNAQNGNFEWDGTTESGTRVSKGMYICKIMYGGKESTILLMAQ